ncbi:MAG: bifunctional response regulator/alkaline phosphatase family protein [Muribaculaceae bacterium]|nr:bifunctional response regulator/alkaline phosphatase family protein [Muribaculaceae bacterium]
MNSKPKILWADDEIDLLKPHIMFLEAKGYELLTACSGVDALHICAETAVDLVILDENMPGISGLDTLARIKENSPHIPVIMITKSEEENIMDQAIGSKIADYLIKPVNPNQILLSIKKILHSGQLVAQKSLSAYRDEFARISSMTFSASTLSDWYELYRKLTYWQMELEAPDSSSEMADILASQINEANSAFAKYVTANYRSWLDDTADTPLMSHRVMTRRIMPQLKEGKKLWLIIVDNFRLDQWLSVSPMLSDLFAIDTELYCALLPTATQYCRNAIFSGLLPADIARSFPELWVDEDSEEGKNLNESPLIESYLRRMRQNFTFSYTKINDSDAASRLADRFTDLKSNDLNVVVVNFIDMLSHARTESKTLRELAGSDAAYRSITASWFVHSPLKELFRSIAASGASAVITTDHGTIAVDNPVKVAAEKNINSNLRYKIGRNLGVNASKVFAVTNPNAYGLPSTGVSCECIFAKNRDFFAYPNNFNHYSRHFRGTFQHGGVSMHEMLVPLAVLTPKNQQLI